MRAALDTYKQVQSELPHKSGDVAYGAAVYMVSCMLLCSFSTASGLMDDWIKEADASIKP